MKNELFVEEKSYDGLFEGFEGLNFDEVEKKLSALDLDQLNWLIDKGNAELNLAIKADEKAGLPHHEASPRRVWLNSFLMYMAAARREKEEF
jgi:hypothetical protein